jgi:hypothetical protein
MLDALVAQGESLELAVDAQPFDAWKTRSILGFGGQILQLASSFMRPPIAGIGKRLDSSLFVFAAANLLANTINLKYDHGEQVDDKHQLRYLKQKVNRELSVHLKDSEAPIDIDENRQALRPHEEPHHKLDGAKNFLRRHSVAIGELGLRYFGAIALAFPARYWKAAVVNRSFPAMDPSPLRVYTGLSSIVGKTVALTSKIPDPYNPKPHTWVDQFREKASFLTGGLIEVTSFTVLAYDAFTRKNGLLIGGKVRRDWLGGIGASMFTLGYIVRSWAKFGERTVNMDELCAHASDTIAKTSPEKVTQLLANTAASLAEHFKDRPTAGFAAIYTQLANDFSYYHPPQPAEQPSKVQDISHLKSKALHAVAPRPAHRIQGHAAAEGMVAEGRAVSL